jgi:hypothetical protein
MVESSGHVHTSGSDSFTGSFSSSSMRHVIRLSQLYFSLASRSTWRSLLVLGGSHDKFQCSMSNVSRVGYLRYFRW